MGQLCEKMVSLEDKCALDPWWRPKNRKWSAYSRMIHLHCVQGG